MSKKIQMHAGDVWNSWRWWFPGGVQWFPAGHLFQSLQWIWSSRQSRLGADEGFSTRRNIASTAPCAGWDWTLTIQALRLLKGCDFPNANWRVGPHATDLKRGIIQHRKWGGQQVGEKLLRIYMSTPFYRCVADAIQMSPFPVAASAPSWP